MQTAFFLPRVLVAFTFLLLSALPWVKAGPVVTGGDAGMPPLVKIFNGQNGNLTDSIQAYPNTFLGGVRVALGDVNGDGTPDIITGAGPGAGPQVKVFNGTNGAEIRSFFAFDANYVGGVHVAAGDVNGDGMADIIVGTGVTSGGGAVVRVFRGTDLFQLASFIPYSTIFNGGVHVAAGDVNGDGFADIITGAGAGKPHVRVFHGRTLSLLESFLAYPASDLAGGVHVAAGDVNGDGRADIIAGAGFGSPPRVKVFSGKNGAEIRSFSPYEAAFVGGVRVAAGDVNGDGRADIMVSPGLGRGGLAKTYNGRNGGLLASFFPYDPAFIGGVYVGGLSELPVFARTDPATDATVTTATLHGTVNPHGRNVSVQFQYGPTAVYGTTVDADPPTLSNSLSTSVSADIVGLKPAKTYHFRVITNDGIGGIVYGLDRTFTTIANKIPVGGTFVVTPASPVVAGTVLTATFNGWTDPDFHTPLQYEVREGNIVISTKSEDPVANFILPAGTHQLTGRIYDNVGGFAEVGPVEVVVTGLADSEVLFSTGETAPGAGFSTIPSDAIATSFGVPAMADGSVKFLANYKSSVGRGGGIFSNNTAVVLIGDSVPGAGGGGDLAIPAGAVFKRFKDPVTDNAGHVAFVATMSGTGITAANDTIVVSNARTGSLEVLARKGVVAPGTTGAKYSAFLGVSVAGAGLGGTAFTARLGGTARASDNEGAWWLPSGSSFVVPMVRKGGPGLTTGEKITGFSLHRSWPGTPGHGRGQIDGDQALLHVKLSTGREAQMLAMPGALTPSTATGDDTGDSSVWVRMAQPSSTSDGQTLTVRGTFRPNSAPASSRPGVGILKSTDGGTTWQVLASVGDDATGTEALWTDLGFPVSSPTGPDVAFLGLARAPAGGLGTESGVWRGVATAPVSLLAKKGMQAVGYPAGVTFAAFRSLAHVGGTAGPIFVAKVAGSTVNAGNDTGVWVVDSSGSLRLLFRKGEKIGTKTVKSFTILTIVSGSPGVTRAFNSVGLVGWRALFTDGTTGIVTTQIH